MASKYQDRRIWMNTGAAAKLKNIALEDATVRRTKRIYRQAAKDIEAQVSEIYSQFGTLAKNNRWEFAGLNTPATRKSVSSLISAIDKAGLTDYVPETLRNRMSVLQVKEMNIWLKLQEAGKESHTATKNAILKSMQNSGRIWQDALNAGAGGFVGFDRNICGYMMGMNWEDGNFSTRLWNITRDTWEKVREELTVALANGQQPETTKKHIRQLLVEGHNPQARGSGGINYDVERIIRTETAKASTEADIVRWREAGVTKVQWNASFEKNTCEHCADRDGMVYEINKIMDQPPLHPNCRCYFTAYDEVAAEYPDTTYYKDEQGRYTEIPWAPYHSVIDEKGQLRSQIIPVSDYFWTTSPWTQYTPPNTKLTFDGEINESVADLVNRTYQSIADQFPDFAEAMEETYGNNVTLHRGKSAVVGGKLAKFEGFADAKHGQITINYPDGRKGPNVLSQMAEYAKYQNKKKNWSTGKDNHSIVHEFGHVLNKALNNRWVKAGDIVRYATNTTDTKSALAKVRSRISKYGSKNEVEAFAEIFAKMVSQDPNEMDVITARFASALADSLKLTKRRKISID